MSLLGELQLQNGEAWVELFVLDLSVLSGPVYRFSPDTNASRQPIVWQGNTYNPLPITAEGFASDGTGRAARPKLSAANPAGVFSALASQYGDFVRAKVVRKRTKVKYLDAVNFAGGVNPSADPAACLDDDIFFVTRKAREFPVLELELGSPMELPGVSLPRRQIIANSCAWRYRSGECGYAGGAVANELGKPTTDINQDKCSHTVNGCKLRFGAYAELPFGGFPGATKIPR